MKSVAGMQVKDVEPLLERTLARGEEEPRNARERSRAETRRRLMQAWRELVADSSPAGVSVREVADRAQVSIGAFYCHFEDKDALNSEVALECYAKLVRRLDEKTENMAPDIETRFSSVIGVIMDFVREHPTEAVFLWRYTPSETEEGRQFIAVWQEFWEQRVERYFALSMDGVASDPELDRAVLSRALWGMGEKVCGWWMQQQGRVPRERVINTLSRFVAKGLS